MCIEVLGSSLVVVYRLGFKVGLCLVGGGNWRVERWGGRS